MSQDPCWICGKRPTSDGRCKSCRALPDYVTDLIMRLSYGRNEARRTAVSLAKSLALLLSLCPIDLEITALLERARNLARAGVVPDLWPPDPPKADLSNEPDAPGFYHAGRIPKRQPSDGGVVLPFRRGKR